MATSGITTTAALADSLPSLIDSARIVREFEGHMVQLVSRETLGKGKGKTWKEVSYAALTARAITETTVTENYQQLSDTPFSITPSMVEVATLITDVVADQLDKQAFAKTGRLNQNAIERKKDIDGLIMLDGATTSLGGAGTTCTTGLISAATRRITSNSTEAGKPPIHCVLHGYQIKDLMDEIVAGVGTYPIPEGITSDTLKQGFTGKIAGAMVWEDGNLASLIDSSDDVKGGVFAKEALVLVQADQPAARPERKENIGGGSTALYFRDFYAYGERQAGVWLYEIYTDAAAPTS